MISILSTEGVDVIDQIAAARALLAFDYDGTLAPYNDDCAAAGMRPETWSLLRTGAILYPCVIVSGRARSEVAARVEGIPLIGVVGYHGAEAGVELIDRLRAQVAGWHAHLEPLLAGIEGVEIENKGYSMALHHRRSPSWTTARLQIRNALVRLKDAVVFEGHGVVYVLPKRAPTKANAIRELCTRFALDVVVYVGGGRPDDEAFRCDAVSVAIRIGLVPVSSARFALADQLEIDELLRELIVARARVDGRQGEIDGIVRALRPLMVPPGNMRPCRR